MRQDRNKDERGERRPVTKVAGLFFCANESCVSILLSLGIIASQEVVPPPMVRWPHADTDCRLA